MNKSDIKLIGISFFIAIILFVIINSIKNDNPKYAVVYFNNDEVLRIDLSLDEKEYTVNGLNGEIKIMAGNGKIKVIDETSDKHLCSKQGYISESYQSIICLPNKVVIEIEDKEDLDTTI